MGWGRHNAKTRSWLLVGRRMGEDGWRQPSEPWKYCNSSHTGFVWHFHPYPGGQSIKEKVPVQLWARSAQQSVFCLHVKRLCWGLNGALFAFAHGLNPHVISLSKCQLFNCAGRARDVWHVSCVFRECQVEGLHPHSCHIHTDQSEFLLRVWPHAAKAQGCLATWVV